MQIVIKQTVPDVWTITLSTATGPATGRTPYPSAEAAVIAAKNQHPGIKIEVQEDMKKNTDQEANAEQEARIDFQWEVAKKLYAAHLLLGKAPPLNREKIVNFMRQALIDFEKAGGNVQTDTDIFGQCVPDLRCENGLRVPYEAGRFLADDFIYHGWFR